MTANRRKTCANRLTAFLLAVSMLMMMGSCSIKKGANEFGAWLEGLPTRMMGSQDLNLEFIFEDAREYGFSDELLTLPFNTRDDYLESEKESKQLLEELEGFDYRALSESQKLTYDVMKDTLTRTLGSARFYFLDNNYLGSATGFQAQLPMLLNEWTFERQHDLDSYFHILETAKDTFLQYAQNEKERQEQGAGLSQAVLEEVIDQCETLVGSDNSFLIETNNAKIDAADFLNEEQKAQAKEKNEALVLGEYLDAYRALAEQLRSIPSTNTENLGLASQEYGKEYYEYLIKTRAGLDMSVKEIKKYLNSQIGALYERLDELLEENPDLLEQFAATKIQYTEEDSFEGVLDYLKGEITSDYPATANLNYKVTEVPEAMRDHFSPAAYLVGKIDAPQDEPQAIYVNGTFSQDLFSTLAHEGYPGHMYQNSFFKATQPPTVRYLLDCNGYTEGWATYVENNCYKYAQSEDKNLLELTSLNERISQAVICLLDIGIHYDGWDKGEYLRQAKVYFDLEDEVLYEQYLLNLENPTDYLQYYLCGAKFQELYDGAKTQLGVAFDPVKFHEVLLKTGPASFSILQKQVDAYISAAKRG